MSFFYDRDQNVTGTIPSSLPFSPSYGIQVSFSTELANYTTVDNYLYNIPKGVNHLQMQISMPFENRKQEDARKIVGFFESLHGTGYFQYTDPAQIYKPVNLFLNSVDNSYETNDLFNITANLSTDQASTLLNWNNLFITGSNIKGNWATSTAYAKYDVVRYTGNATFPSNTGNLYDSFYYCKEAHTSQSSITPASVDTIKWSKEFFFQPTYAVQLSKETSVIKTELPYSFTKRTNFGLHSNTLKSFKLDFKGISDAEARCILHFLIGRQGYKKFQYKIPNIYNQFKVFFAPEWTHTFVYKNVNDISVTLIEDPIGKSEGEIDNISTNGLALYLDAANRKSYPATGTLWYDLSGSQINGTLVNGPTFNIQNKGNLIFDGTNDYVSVSNTSLGVGGKPPNCTMTIWAKINRTSTFQQIAGFRNDSNFSFFFLLLDSGGATVNTEARIQTSANTYDIAVDFMPYFNKWTHITFAAYETFSRLYLNGVLVGSNTSVSGSFGSTSQNFTIGSHPNGGSFLTNGSISSVLFYNRGLTQQEIVTNFNAGRDKFKI